MRCAGRTVSPTLQRCRRPAALLHTPAMPAKYRRSTGGFTVVAEVLLYACRPESAHDNRGQELCESRGGRPGLPVPKKPTVSVDVKQPHPPPPTPPPPPTKKKKKKRKKKKKKREEVCSTSTETVGLLGTGAEDGHSDFHTPPELWRHRRKL